MSGQGLVKVWSMSCPCLVLVSSMSCPCLVNVWSMSGQCLVKVWSRSGQCLVHVVSMSCQCLVHVCFKKCRKLNWFWPKHHVGRVPNYQWVFGGYCQAQGVGFVILVPNRTKETLWRHIRENIEPGSKVVSDGWRAYEGLDRMPVRQFIVFIF